jgi:hypothetical protein
MILVFKDFLEAVKRGDERRDLFICKNKAELKYEMQRMMDDAFAMNLNPQMRITQNVINFGPSFAMFRVVHPFLDMSCKGIQFNAIQGLMQFDMYENMEDVKKNLEMQVR